MPHTGSCARLLGPLTRPGTQATACALRCLFATRGPGRQLPVRSPRYCRRRCRRIIHRCLRCLRCCRCNCRHFLTLLEARLMARSGVGFFASLSLWVDSITVTPTDKALRLLLTKVSQSKTFMSTVLAVSFCKHMPSQSEVPGGSSAT